MGNSIISCCCKCMNSTTSAPHGFNVGMGVTISDIIVNCNYGSGIHTFTTATNNAITDSGNNSYNVTDATYDDSTGDLVLTTPAASALSVSDTITFSPNSIKFTCVADNHSTEHSYPRTTDPVYNTPVSVTNVTGTTITVNVGPVSGGQTKTYPDGNVGYVFTIKEVTDSTTFKTDIGISKYVHNYVSGGSVKINLIRPFDGKVVYFDDLYYTVGKIKLTNRIIKIIKVNYLTIKWSDKINLNTTTRNIIMNILRYTYISFKGC